MSTSLGLSAGSGMIHCVLLTTDDSGRQSSVSRVIDVDVTDGLTRAGRVNSGIDLMLGNAQDRGGRVGPIGVAYRTESHAREIASRGTGAKRQIQLAAETEAVAHQLRSTGEISRFDSVVVVDLGDTGMSMYTLDPDTGRIADLQRSEAISGVALDALLVQECSTNGRLRGRRRSTVLSACRTAKEELSVSESSSLMIGGSADLGTLTRSAFESLARPMAQAAATAVADYVAASRSDAIVLIGGLANIPLIRTLITQQAGVEAVLPHGPESVAATGAARLAAASSANGLAFIGGRRRRDWLSAAPLAMFGALLAGALMTVYAVGSSLVGNPSTPVTQSASPAVPSAPATTTTAAPPSPSVSAPMSSQVTVTPIPTTDEVALPPFDDGSGDPGWATTELPPPSAPSDSPTRTLNPSLTPFPLPSITWPPALVPPLLPPESTTPEQPSETEPVTPESGPESPSAPALEAPDTAQSGDAQSGNTPSGSLPTSLPAS